MKTFLVGSRYFFNKYEDFKPHDLDTLRLFKSDEENISYIRLICLYGNCYFDMTIKPKEEIIKDALTKGLPMQIGKFLIPEVCDELNMDLEDLKQLHPLIDKLDEKHTYEKIIYDSYLENDEMKLTDELLLKAYELYKKSRNI